MIRPSRPTPLLRSLGLRIAVVAAIAALIEIAWWLWSGQGTALMLAIVSAGAASWMALVSLRAREGEEGRAIVLMGAGIFAALFLALLARPGSGALAFASVIPIFLAAPFLDPRALSRYAIATWPLGMGLVVAAGLIAGTDGAMGPAGLDPGLPFGDVFGTGIVLALLLLLLSRYHLATFSLRHMALHDDLTGLHNRSLFTDRLEHALSGAERRGVMFAVLYLDIDGFKEINDRHGHAYGDDLLRAMADRLREGSRTIDTVARMGGDEFAVLLEDLKGRAEGIAAAERLMGALALPFVLPAGILSMRISAGLTFSDDGGDTAEAIVQNTDFAMYAAKGGPRGSVVVYHAGLRARSEDARGLKRALHGVVERDELRLQYQPIVRLHGGFDERPAEGPAAGTIHGLEALVRWDDPERGTRPPGEFIALAEETGDILPLGRWVLRTACRQLRAWQQLPGARDLRMMVNLSALELEQPGFEDVIARVITEADVSPRSLVLEITEHVMVRDSPRVNEVLRRLRARGIHLAIDDFGTGYSSLSYLHSLPVDGLKIDRSFLSDAVGDEQATALLRAIVNVGVALGSTLVAEGIETPAQLKLLRSLGCHLGQGYLLSRPLDAPDAATLLRSATKPWDDLLGPSPAAMPAVPTMRRRGAAFVAT